jgi:hypothetical protein
MEDFNAIIVVYLIKNTVSDSKLRTHNFSLGGGG